MDTVLAAFVPQDRRRALARGVDLPKRTRGTALFADIAGFTPLTSSLIEALGQRRGVEELPRHLNRVYEALIAEVERFGGSVVGFSGDGITCWFDQADGPAAARATACGLAMQRAMVAFAAILVPHAAPISLTLKVGIATGPARRFVVGDPDIQLIDVLAGETLARIAAAEHIARQGEVVVDAATVQELDEVLALSEWHSDTVGRPYAVVSSLERIPRGGDGAPTAEPDQGDRTAEEDGGVQRGASAGHPYRAWLHPAVWARLLSGEGDLLTELRPAVALFLRWQGIEYDTDEAAGAQLDAFVRWVQGVVAEYEGTLLQLTTGEKGNYLYIAFGAPVAHEDDASRAADVALRLRTPPAGLESIREVQIGLSRGTMRTGLYGSLSRCTYGVLGAETNLAARLMMAAKGGQVVASQREMEGARQHYSWQPLLEVLVKGRGAPLAVWELVGRRQARGDAGQVPYTLPMVGRAAELALLDQRLETAARSEGQVVALAAEAGMGKSRLVEEVVRLARARGFAVHVGEAHAFGASASYGVWRAVWQGVFGLDDAHSVEEQARALESSAARVAPFLLPRLPLLGPLLNLPLADNELTRTMEGELRKQSLEDLLATYLQQLVTAPAAAGAALQPLLLVLEDLHWIDPLSRDLLFLLARVGTRLPVMLLLTYRPDEATRDLADTLGELPTFTPLTLAPLTAGEAGELLHLRLAQAGLDMTAQESEQLAARLMERAEGNPFYLEELFAYLHERGLDLAVSATWTEDGLPNSLNRLILSRIDQLKERQRVTLKVASVIGRLFRVAWLHGYYPNLGEPETVRAELEALSRVQLTLPEAPEPELSYLFKHVVTQEVAYESLSFATRARLHERLARFLEGWAGAETERYLELLAFHYGRSENDAKKREFLWRAAQVAAAAYANEAARAHLEQLLPLTSGHEQVETLALLAEVLNLTGHGWEAQRRYREAITLAEMQDDKARLAELYFQFGSSRRHTLPDVPDDHPLDLLTRARTTFELIGEGARAAEALAVQSYVVYWQAPGHRNDEAWELASQALERGRQEGSAAAQVQALEVLGLVTQDRSGWVEAQLLYERRLELCRPGNDVVELLRAMWRVAKTAPWIHDYARARDLHEEGIELARRVGSPSYIGSNLHHLSWVLACLGELDLARDAAAESLQVSEQYASRNLLGLQELMFALNAVGSVAMEQGEYDEANEYFSRGLALLPRARENSNPNPNLEPVFMFMLGEVALLQGHYEEAQRRFQESVDHRRQNDLGGGIEVLHRLGLVLAFTGDEDPRPYFVEGLKFGATDHDLSLLLLSVAVYLARSARPGPNARAARRALRLSAAAHRVLDALGIVMLRLHRHLNAMVEEHARTTLDAEAFDAARREGYAMSDEEAVAYALQMVTRD